MSNTKAVQIEHREDGIEELQAETAIQLDDSVLIKMADSLENLGDVTHDAATATEFEHKLTFFQAIRMYPKPAFFSMAMSLSLIMEGYDTSLLGNFFGYPAFQRKFGEPAGNGTYQLTATWQSSLQAPVQVGEIIGLWLASALADRYGYKKTMLGAELLMIGVIFMMFFAQNLGMLLAGEILCGLPWGAFQTLTTTYAAEVSPMALRPYLTTYCNMCVSRSPSLFQTCYSKRGV
jgi:SP family general alpha glucoside:H+ symporter-like MFS transporter